MTAYGDSVADVRVVIAPDSFGGTLTATDAAEAIAAGWRQAAPSDALTLVPLADGGTGFTEVLHAAVGGTWHETTVTGPLGEPVAARWLQVGATAYVESAAACGLHLLPRRDPDVARAATTRGVGELLTDALASGVTEVVVGLGGSGTTDGGAGMLAALGLAAVDAAGGPVGDGGAALLAAVRFARAGDTAGDAAGEAAGGAAAGLAQSATRPGPDPDSRGSAGGGAGAGLAQSATRPGPGPDSRGWPAGVRLVAAVDVDNPLLGRHGAAAVFGPQKGADAAAVAELDAALGRFADLLATLGRDMRHEPGAGAAGGLGAALLALGAERVSGAVLVRELVGLDAALDAADLAVTGEGSFDWQSLRGKLITAVARGAAERGVPCVVLAGQVSVGRREAASVGVDAAYAAADEAGGAAASLADPVGTLTALARRVAPRWSRDGLQ